MNSSLLINKLENIFKTDVRYLLHGSFWLSISRLLTAIFSFILAIGFANLLPQESYGQYKYLISLLGLLTVTSLLGLGESLIISAAKGFEGSYKKALFTRIRWSLIGSAISFCLGFYYYFSGDNLLGLSLFAIALALPFYNSPQTIRSVLNGRKKYKEISNIDIIEAVFCSTAVLIVLLLTKNILFVFAIYVISHVIIRWIIYCSLIKKIEPNQLTEPGTISYGKHLSCIRLLAHIGNHIDKVLVWHFIGAAPLAIYSMAVVMPAQLRSLLKTLQPLALPKFAQNSSKNIKKTLPRKVFLLYLLIVPLILIYLAISPHLFNIFFSQYAEAVLYSQVFSLLLLFYPMNFYYQAILSKIKKKQLYLIANSTQIIKIVSLISLLPSLGLWSLILAEFISALYNSIIVYLFFKKL